MQPEPFSLSLSLFRGAGSEQADEASEDLRGEPPRREELPVQVPGAFLARRWRRRREGERPGLDVHHDTRLGLVDGT